MLSIIKTAAHTAHLDHARGAGLLLCPDPAQDVWDGPYSINGEDWNAITKALVRSGWDLLLDDWDLPVEISILDGGRTTVGLWRDTDPLTEGPAYDAAILDLLARVAD